MTPRERVLAILNGGQPDQVPWFADLDYYATSMIARGERSADFKQSDEYIDWHRELGVGFYLQGYMPFREIVDGCSIEEHRDGDVRIRRISTPKGTLEAKWKWSKTTYSEAPVERLVKTERDLPAYRWYFEHLRYEPNHELANRRRELVKDIGVVLCYTPRSPLMRLVAVDSGIEHIVPIYMNAPDEFDETLAVMKKTLDAAVDITVAGPADIVMIPENLSSEVVGKTFFEMFMREFQSDWVKRIHAAGKFSTMHLDGTLRGLLHEEALVGFSFIEAMTPAPAGDLPLDEWKDYLAGTNVVAWGGLPGAFFSERMSDVEFDSFVIDALAVMKSEPRYVLGVADQVPPDGSIERVARVRSLVDTYGKYDT